MRIVLGALVAAIALASCKKVGKNEYQVQKPTVGLDTDTVRVGMTTDTIKVPTLTTSDTADTTRKP